MDLQQRLNKIASDFGLNGNQSAGLALAACVLLDRNNEVAFDGRDLAGTLTRLLETSGAAAKIEALGLEAEVGFTPENVANKSTNVTTDGASDTKYPSAKAVKTYADALIASLLDSAPGALNTLNELAAALGDDENFATTVTNALAEKAALATAMGVVVHGAVANTARPAGYAVVTWIGSVEPDNAINNDLWEEVP